MKASPTRPRVEFAVVAAAVFLVCGLSHTALATDSWLAVHHTNGCDWYALEAIDHIRYVGDELHVTTTDDTDIYGLEMIVRIDFVPDSPTVGVDGRRDRPVAVDPSHLFQNYPNPFSPETQITFDLTLAGRAALRIYDASGRLIRTLVDERRSAGPHNVIWDGRDESGRAVASGIYFYSLTAPGVNENRRMILVK